MLAVHDSVKHRFIYCMQDTKTVLSLKRLTENFTSLSFHPDTVSQVTLKSGTFYYPKIPNVSGLMTRQQHAHNIHNFPEFMENPPLKGDNI